MNEYLLDIDYLIGRGFDPPGAIKIIIVRIWMRRRADDCRRRNCSTTFWVKQMDI
jgi:hypothetical protein